MKKVKILAVGIGGYAQGYLSELLEDENHDFEIVGMVDVAPETSLCYPALTARGVKLYSTMEEFYAADTADLAIIVTPIHFHTSQILCALRHGSNVLCEKPLSGVSSDEELLLRAIEETGKFVMIGYQWSYSRAVLDLKADISVGVYGKPQMLKSLVFWPRPKEYYKRGSGWGGRIHAPDGTVINDSVVSNATAHYLHNMLYVTGGAHGRSSEVADVEATLLRVNAIENFDTAAVKFTMENGAKGLFVVSHSTKETVNPEFEYRFEKGVVSYDSVGKQIVGTLSDGTVKNYGDPSSDLNRKIYEAIAAVRALDVVTVCGVQAAAPQVRCVEKIQKCPVYPVKQSAVGERVVDGSHYLYAEGLDALLRRCYQEERILNDLKELVDIKA